MKGWKTLLFCLLALSLLMACAVEQLYLQFYIDSQAEALRTPAGSSDEPVDFTIAPGDTIATIAGNLKAMRLISDTELFRRYVQFKGLDSGIQAGNYTLRQTMTIPEIARELQHASAPEQQVTLPEGKRLEEIAELVAQQTTIDADAFLTLVQTGWRSGTWREEYPILQEIPITATLEGFLFPDTYRLPQNPTPADLLHRMLDNLEQQLSPTIRQGFAEHGLSLYEGFILASIVEREAVHAHERPLISGVFHNRLRDGWFLAACPTVQYALGYRPDEQTWWKRQLFFSDLEVVSPYNTYRNPGLPPTPIASPGQLALAAAANPAETDYYFFMVDCDKEDRSHVFSRTEAEHMANFQRCGGVITAP